MQAHQIRRFTEEGPDLNSQVRIIAVEFAVRGPDGQEVELEMFPCKHTLSILPAYNWYQVRFTMHTSRGDKTITQQIGF